MCVGHCLCHVSLRSTYIQVHPGQTAQGPQGGTPDSEDLDSTWHGIISGAWRWAVSIRAGSASPVRVWWSIQLALQNVVAARSKQSGWFFIFRSFGQIAHHLPRSSYTLIWRRSKRCQPNVQEDIIGRVEESAIEPAGDTRDDPIFETPLSSIFRTIPKRFLGIISPSSWPLELPNFCIRYNFLPRTHPEQYMRLAYNSNRRPKSSRGRQNQISSFKLRLSGEFPLRAGKLHLDVRLPRNALQFNASPRGGNWNLKCLETHSGGDAIFSLSREWRGVAGNIGCFTAYACSRSPTPAKYPPRISGSPKHDCPYMWVCALRVLPKVPSPDAEDRHI
ncbi:hypothetical protein DFH09DRAFT_1296425 [Mycena vulgaris]|nr:hypothetical protein DFH09DRAFT_1296425 [Mycena vulgaris]